jgi:hypothetical protein
MALIEGPSQFGRLRSTALSVIFYPLEKSYPMDKVPE